jgi:hypothetical protein
MDHPARRLRFRFRAVLAPVVFVVVLVVLIGSAVYMFVILHIASPFLGKLLLQWEMHHHRASGLRTAASRP